MSQVVPVGTVVAAATQFHTRQFFGVSYNSIDQMFLFLTASSALTTVGAALGGFYGYAGLLGGVSVVSGGIHGCYRRLFTQQLTQLENQYRGDLDRERTATTELLSELTTAQTVNTQLSENTARLEARLEKLKITITELQIALATLQETNQTLSKLLDGAKVEEKEIKETNADMQTKIGEFEHQSDTLKTDIQEMKDLLPRISKDKHAAEDFVTKFTDSLEKSEKRVTELEEMMHQVVTDLQAEEQLRTKEENELKETTDELKKIIEPEAAKYNEFKTSNEQLIEQLKSLRTALETPLTEMNFQHRLDALAREEQIP
jgi:chromosome segregation ATPase